MSNTITASNVPSTVPVDKVKEFFEFSGKVDSVIAKATEGEFTTYQIKFAAPEAVSSAVLLNGAELDGKPIKIIEEASTAATTVAPSNPPAPAGAHDTWGKVTMTGVTPESSTIAAAAKVPYTEAGVAANQKTTAAAAADATAKSQPASNDSKIQDIEQEHKPKSAIIAEYLSHGYVLSDQAVDKAIELDKKHGISTKFKGFLSNLDSKYHVQEKASEANAKYGFDKKLAKGRSDLSSYFEKASQTDAGAKLHTFYTGIASDSKQIHQEARRLADLKQSAAGSTSKPSS
ncbi:hypothetical protein DASC09_016050 [Saccharomycopsis crataegensis]|uniref:RRM domain-containing protein n=1 Tax=Saccharomycopsis crataegensis TaxID=43959 RepID=A0AAV5QIS2_9ASCO|nr:hypothetical protein DASC09_016050 [Saccharomycopsis crataegensis]